MSEPWPDLDPIRDLFVVREDLAYAIWRDGLVYYDGDRWSVVPGDALPIDDAERVWGDDDDVWVAGRNGQVVSRVGTRWVLHDVGTIELITSIWGFDGDDVWVGTVRGGLFHYDGVAWSEMAWPNLATGDACDGLQAMIEGFWGVDGVLFFRTHNQIVRGNRDGFVVIAHWPSFLDGATCRGGLQLAGMWGNSPTELFVAAMDPSLPNAECDSYAAGRPFFLFWDGAAFHWF